MNTMSGLLLGFVPSIITTPFDGSARIMSMMPCGTAMPSDVTGVTVAS